MDLPFKLNKYHKSSSKYQWKYKGVIFTPKDFEEIYNKYIYATNCELCNTLFPNTRDRCLDHDHETGKIRNIVCQKCNQNKRDNKLKGANTGERNICKVKNKKYKQGYCFRVAIRRNEKYILNTMRKTLEEAVIVRDTFIREHPEIYS
tara:strand:+ start:363 stop:806 length:444 start_codon:yes stop_codon:yes gene_type:complete